MDFSFEFDGVRNNIAPVRAISPMDGKHYFFGYYDLQPYSPDGRRHLAARIPFDMVLNGPDDVMEFGWIEDGEFYPLLETTCWNFQQGILATYQRSGGNVIFYNILDKEAGCYRTVRHNLDTGKKDYSPMACGTVSHDGTHGLGINFSRIWDFRPGYGYPNLPDPYADIPHPAEDGIFLCDFDKGTTKQLCSCEQLAKLFPMRGRENSKMVVNHITLNPAGDRYLFLYRSFPDPNRIVPPGKSRWTTVLFSGDMEGNVKFIYDEMVSHYWWEDNETMIAFARPEDERNGVWRVNMIDGSYEEIRGDDVGPKSLRTVTGAWDIHCSLSPDGRFMIGDNYPDKEGYRKIFIHEMATGRTEVLLETYSPYADDHLHIPNGSKEARCDLHARWNRDGTRVSFDAIARGHREIFEIDMTKLKW